MADREQAAIALIPLFICTALGAWHLLHVKEDPRLPRRPLSIHSFRSQVITVHSNLSLSRHLPPEPEDKRIGSLSSRAVLH